MVFPEPKTKNLVMLITLCVNLGSSTKGKQAKLLSVVLANQKLEYLDLKWTKPILLKILHICIGTVLVSIMVTLYVGSATKFLKLSSPSPSYTPSEFSRRSNGVAQELG